MTATLHHNTRDVYTLSKKVLMTDIKNDDGTEFRDHCWVTITDELESYIPRSNRKKAYLKFDATVHTYKTTGPAKNTLNKIKNITVA